MIWGFLILRKSYIVDLCSLIRNMAPKWEMTPFLFTDQEQVHHGRQFPPGKLGNVHTEKPGFSLIVESDIAVPLQLQTRIGSHDIRSFQSIDIPEVFHFGKGDYLFLAFPQDPLFHSK